MALTKKKKERNQLPSFCVSYFMANYFYWSLELKTIGLSPATVAYWLCALGK